MKKTARFLSLALVCLMLLPLLSALPVKVKATEPVVYEVSNCAELVEALTAHNVSKDPTETIRLTDDIILDPATFGAIGDRYIYGTFDGQNHTIYNMTNDLGSLIWPYGNSLIENFTVSGKTAPDGENLVITQKTSIFGEQPTADEVKEGETSVIRNVINERSLTSGVNNYGGFFFRQFTIAGTIRFENCINRADYKCTSNANYKLAGFIGYMNTGTVEFVNCSNEGDIYSSQSGGFISVYRNGNSTVRMINCTNSGTITGRYSSSCYGVAGGFIGGRDNAGSIGYNVTIEMTNCVNTGDILIASSGSTKTNGIGGLIGCVGAAASGKNLSITLTKCRVENCTIDTNGTDVYAAPLIGRCSPGSVSTYKIDATCCSVSNVDVIGGTARKLIGVVSANDSTKPVATACEFNNVTEDGSAVWNGNALDSVKCVLMTPYAEIADGEELLAVDFDAAYMDPGFVITGEQADNNDDLDIAVTDDGNTVTFTSINANNKRGIWGAALPAATFPLSAGTKYTVYFTLTMEAGMKCAFYPDGKQGIAIIQNNTYTKYQSWSTMNGTEANWANKTDYGNKLKNFAVEIDYDTGTITLYGQHRNGLYVYINQATGLTFDSDVLYCAFWAGNTAGKTVTVSDVSIEKGKTVPVLDANEIGYTAYQAAPDSSLLRTVNFKQDGWNPEFADSNNLGADVDISNDGTAVTFTVHSNHNKRAMWGNYLVDTLPLYSGGYNSSDGVKYTFVYDVTFGNANVGVGLQVDGSIALVVDGAGNSYWYRWNDKHNASDANTNWLGFTDVPADEKQTFAVTMDYNAHTFELYVMRSNGSFAFVRSITRNVEDWSGSRVRPRINVRAITGTPDETYTATVSNLKIYKGLTLADRYVLTTADGAAVRLDNPTGLRFTGFIGKNLLDELKTEYGAGNVKVGMLITPTDYLTANSLAFTKEALDGCGSLPAGKKYVKIDASTILESEDGNAYKINCVLSNVLEDNYARKFSAVTYIEVNGSTYYYADYSEENNARSITYVAEAALLDLSDTQTGEYQYEVDGKYSPYTAAQRTTLAGFRGAGILTVMSYNVEVYDDDDGWDGRDPEKAIETMLAYSPDILGLQEVNQVVEKNWLGVTTRDDGWDDYLPTLTEHGYTRLTGNYTGAYNFEKNEIFYKTSKFTKLAEGTKTFKQTAIDLSVPNDENADQSLDGSERIFHYAALQEISTGKKVLVVSAHLHYGGTGAGHEEDDKVRRYEIRTLVAWLETMRATYPNQIVTGDMNAHYLSGTGKPAMDIYKDAGFSITRDTAAIKGDTGGTLANSRTTRPEWIFDYILTKGDLSALSYTAIDNKIDNGGTTYPSDHLPVMATILFD